MFATKQIAPSHPAAKAYPRFGGRLVRGSVTGHPATVALALVAAIAATALSLPSFAGPAEICPAQAVQAQTATVVEAPVVLPRGEVRTTAKADRLKPRLSRQGCDGVWGNEPLECLLQTA